MRLLIITHLFKQDFKEMVKHFPKRIDVKIVPSHRIKNGHLKINFSLLNEIMRFSPDIICTDNTTFSLYFSKVYQFIKRKRIPIILRLRGVNWLEGFMEIEECKRHFYENVTFRNLLAFIKAYLAYSLTTKNIKYFDLILPISKWLEEETHKEFADVPTKMIYIGVEPSLFYKQKASSFKFKHPNVGIVQGYRILQKVNGLIQFKEVIEKLSDVHFYLADDGNYLEYAKSKLNLDNVRFIGRLKYPDEVREFHAATDLYVIASGLDTLGVTVLEASLCEKAVIGSKIGGIPETIMDGKSGWTIENGNHEEWIKKINLLLENPDLAREMGKQGREYIKENFSCEIISKQFLEVIEDFSKP